MRKDEVIMILSRVGNTFVYAEDLAGYFHDDRDLHCYEHRQL